MSAAQAGRSAARRPRKAERPAARRAVLVTGAAGSLAQRVIARLYPQHDVVAVDFRRKVETDLGIASYQVQVNKRDFDEVFARHAIQAVVHIGRIFAHESDRQRRYNANVLGTRRLLDLCLKHRVAQTLILSSYFVYGASPYNPALLDEDFPLKVTEATQDLLDSVELESLAHIHLWKHPELNITILRPCNVLGPGVRNTLSLMLSRRYAPVLAGFSPMMQFLHVDDMAAAIVAALEKNRPGIYNVAPEDWVAYQDAVAQCGCRRLLVPSLPPALPRLLSHLLPDDSYFPTYMINYLKYPVIIDGGLFRRTFGWKPRRTLNDIFSDYRKQKLALAGGGQRHRASR